MEAARIPILIGESGAAVFLVRGRDGTEWIDKVGVPDEIGREAAVLAWCQSRLPVPAVMRMTPGGLSMAKIPGVNLTEVADEMVVTMIVEALRLVHSVPIDGCPFDARWAVRLEQAERRVAAGLADDTDFDDENRGRSAADVLAEVKSLPSPPPLTCFTHGDACLPNFLTDGEHLTGIVDVGRAGVAHPAQDWALALRSVRDNRGADAERLLRQHLPEHCVDEELLRQFRLLDELF